ncbi:hypothetical protein M433DRAFT_72636 [Acidomyces richmondensis BFW]|nr:MAG: hypothetical protein FE78DRAFT_156059 [Acidomyces sp. 'richmondensis']KYG42997.1 hypothetical protein M433DRAFT_72636 [Acidomyces richmondensis BFW]
MKLKGSERNTLRLEAANTRKIEVGIVGAGIAGLRCADVLLQHGFRVTMFEARNRLGGRIAQSEHLGHAVDLGPNWIHGSTDNPVLRLAKETKTTLHVWDEKQAMFDSDGRPLDADEVDELARLLWDDGAIPDAFRYSKQHRDLIDSNKSLYDFLVERSNTLFEKNSASVANEKRIKFLQAACVWGTYVGSHVTRQSLKNFWLEECIEGENPFVAGTYGKILQAVAKTAQEKANIKLNTVVVGITSDEIKGNPSSKIVTIETMDGSKYTFDEVVVTTPLGWLKKNKNVFNPPLSNRLSRAIDHIGYGSLDKIYISFPSAFWDDFQPSICKQANEFDPRNSTSSVTATSTPTHPSPYVDMSKQGGHFAGATHWLSPAYAVDTNPKQWDLLAMNLAALPDDSAHPTLLFYIYGDCSQHIASLISAADSQAVADKILISYLKPYYSKLPNYDPSNPECIPKAVLATAWAKDEFAGCGSYSNFQIGLDKGDEDIEVMRWGMPERGIWLAGEHTAPFIALGTTTGAYWSGEEVANRIAYAFGVLKGDRS